MQASVVNSPQMELPQISIETLLLIPTNDNALDPSVYRGVEVLCKNLKVKNFASKSLDSAISLFVDVN